MTDTEWKTIKDWFISLDKYEADDSTYYCNKRCFWYIDSDSIYVDNINGDDLLRHFTPQDDFALACQDIRKIKIFKKKLVEMEIKYV